MEILAAPYLMAAVLLATAGATKVITPIPAATALLKLGAGCPPWVVRLLGLVELTIAVSAFVVGGILPASALAVLYGGLTLVALAMLRADPGAECGCFGPVPMPVSYRHVVLNLLALATGVTAAITRTEPVDKLFVTDRWLYAPLGIAVTAGACGAFLWLTLPPAEPNNQP